MQHSGASDDARHWEGTARALVGSMLAGKWRLDALRGVGGTSAVFAATNINGRRVAIKVLRPHLAASPSARARLRREAYLANKLADRGAVAVLDDGVDGDSVFLVMDLLDGETLRARARARGERLPLEETMDIADGLLAILDAAHRAGIVHRDVKPDNVFLELSGGIRMLDFGLARLDGWSGEGTATGSHATMGTPAFMAPEQARGRTSEVDARADVWGAGATLFTLLTGRFVHEATTAAEMIFLAGTQPASPIAAFVPDMPGLIAQVIDRALAFSPADRWAAAGEMRAALHSARASASGGLARSAKAGALVTLPEGSSPPRDLRPPARTPASAPVQARGDVLPSAAEPTPAASSGIPGPGEIVAERYQVEQVLGSGGMGIVVAARHLKLGQRVAIKFIRGEAALDEHAVARFLREAQATAALTSEHVARVFDVGTLDSGAAYMVMEHLAGVDLAELVGRQGAIAVTEAVDYVLQASEAIAEAHAKGIVHRDLKPSNLFLARRVDGTPLVKVLDFGVSKIKMTDVGAPAMRQDLTASGTIMGSPLYMSPEQVRSSRDVDARSDVWALGVILYELLTGGPPFLGETLGETFAHILGDDPAPLRQRRPDVPAELATVVGRCLERDIERRFQTVAALAVQLLPFAPANAGVSVDRIRRLSEELAAARSPEGAPVSRPTLTAAAAVLSPRGASRRGAGRLVAGGVTLVAVGTMAVWATSHFVPSPGTVRAAAQAPSERAAAAPAPPVLAPSPPLSLDDAAPRDVSRPDAGHGMVSPARSPVIAAPPPKAPPAQRTLAAPAAPAPHPSSTSHEQDIF